MSLPPIRVRAQAVTGYRNYLIFYMPLDTGGVEILHVIHGARDLDSILEEG